MLKKQVMSFDAPDAKGPYSCAVKLGDFVYISGVLPKDCENNMLADLNLKEQTEKVLNNIESILEEMDLTTYNIVKSTVFLTDMSKFSEMNEVYGNYFTEPYPARSVVEVQKLEDNAQVMIECFVVDTLKYENNENPCKGCPEHCEDCGI